MLAPARPTTKYALLNDTDFVFTISGERESNVGIHYKRRERERESNVGIHYKRREREQRGNSL